jgi:KEOPS complex subunit Cgi121
MAMMQDQCEIRVARCTVRDRSDFLETLRTTAGRLGTHIICFNANMIAGERHVRKAVFNAVRSFRQGNPISNTLEMEALLYAAGTRQCAIASSFGIHEGENRIYVCCYPVHNEVWEALSLCLELTEENDEEMDPQKQARLVTLFEISDEELETVGKERITDLVLERVALLNAVR